MRPFARDTGGAIAVMTALVMPVLIGVAAYAIDASLLLYRQERLQVAADIGAQAGADLLRRGESETAASAFAEAMVAVNAGVAAGTLIEVSVTFPEPGGLVHVDAALQVDRIFSQIFGRGAFVVRASGTGAFAPEDDPLPCVYLDGGHAGPGLTLGNGIRMTFSGCDVVVASDVNLGRGARLEADCVTAGGRFTGHLPDVSCAGGPFDRAAPIPPQPAFPDAPRPASTDCAIVPNNSSGRLQPRAAGIAPPQLYFCDGLTIKRNATVRGDAGFYFISGGDLVIEDRGALELDPGAVIVLMDKSKVTMEGRSSLALEAPGDGPYEGVVILAGDHTKRAEHAPLLHRLSALDVEGLIALPGEGIIIEQSNSERCTRIFADTLEMDKGGTSFDSTCSGGG